MGKLPASGLEEMWCDLKDLNENKNEMTLPEGFGRRAKRKELSLGGQ